MKKHLQKTITNDLSIVAIEISIALLGVTVTFRYLDEYEFEVYYERGAPSFKWIGTDNLPGRASVDVELEIEDYEEEIVEWLESQFLAEQYATA